MNVAAQIAGVVLVLAAAGWLGWRWYQRSHDTSPAATQARKLLRAAQTSRKRTLRPIDKTLAKQRRSLARLTSTRGRKLGRYAKITLYELWVETPSGAGELSREVDAFVDDASSSRFTATRFLALGAFALAFKKKTGKVFLSVDHPGFVHLSTVGPKERERATKFAAKIKNAGRHAETLRIERPREAERLSVEMGHLERKRLALQSRHDAAVRDAEAALQAAGRPQPSQPARGLPSDRGGLPTDPWGLDSPTLG